MNPPTPETFTAAQINDALEQFLEYGKDTLLNVSGKPKPGKPVGHMGYFSGMGFAARALRYLLAQRKEAPAPVNNYLHMPTLSGLPTAEIAGMRRCEKLRKDVNALIESRSGGTLEAVSSPESKIALLRAGGYLKVRLCLSFKDNTSEYHKPFPEPVPEIPIPTAEPPVSPLEDIDAKNLQAAQDLDAGKAVDGMVLKWARFSKNQPSVRDVRLIHLETYEFADAENEDLYSAINVARLLLTAKIKIKYAKPDAKVDGI